MSLHNYIARLRIIDQHISAKTIGNMEILSQKLDLSTPGGYKFLKEMRDEGIPVKYSKKENRFYYTTEGKIVEHFFLKDTVNKNAV